MQFEYIEKHIFSGISDYFRRFLSDALTPLHNKLVINNVQLNVDLLPVFWTILSYSLQKSLLHRLVYVAKLPDTLQDKRELGGESLWLILFLFF